MIIKHGDLFTTDLEVIGHGVNTVGVMGAGVAKRVRDDFPKTYRIYKSDCKMGYLTPGLALPGVKEDGKFIINIASQELPGANATYAYLAQGVEAAVIMLKATGRDSMALPQIGCGIGGLEWYKVEQILIALEKDYDFEFEVWIYA